MGSGGGPGVSFLQPTPTRSDRGSIYSDTVCWGWSGPQPILTGNAIPHGPNASNTTVAPTKSTLSMCFLMRCVLPLVGTAMGRLPGRYVLYIYPRAQTIYHQPLHLSDRGYAGCS